MSEILQSGQDRNVMQHPDADQLSAFAEHALPEHERQATLLHLAVCLDCRAIVALSLPPAESVAEPPPTPVRSPWFSGWNLAWPIAAAFAGFAMFFVYIHTSERDGKGTKGSAEALNRPSTQSGTAIATIGAVQPGKMQGSRKEAQSTPEVMKTPVVAPPLSGGKQLRPEAALDKPDSAGTHAGTEDRKVEALQIQGRNTGPLATSPTISAGMGAGATGAASRGTPAPRSHDGALAIQPLPQVAAAPVQAPAPTPTPASEPPEPAREEAKASAGSQTVEVAAAPPMPTTQAVVSDEIQTENEVVVNQAQIATMPLLRKALPSRQPILSLVARGHEIVAIDAQSALFMSKDDGKHWTAVSPKWQGRAVKVALAGSTTGISPHSARAAAAGAPGAGSGFTAVTGALPGSPITGPSLTGTVTDQTGAVIPEAKIVVVNTATHSEIDSKTDGSGRYVLANPAAGTYDLEVRAPGFQMKSIRGIAVSASQPTVENLTLDVGAASQTVMVESEAAPLSKSKAARLKAPSAIPAPPLFELTTDSGERWTSADGPGTRVSYCPKK
jgi:hypothetical protein